MTPEQTEQKLALLQKVLNEKLLEACEDGDYHKAKEALEQGAEVNCCGENGWTPLHIAVGWFHFDIVALLLDNDAQINSETKKGETAVSIAYSLNSKESCVMENFLRHKGGKECSQIL